MRLFIGGQSSTIQGEPCILNGDRCFSAFYSLFKDGVQILDPNQLKALGDSGAFQNVKEGTRLSFADALERQLSYEAKLGDRFEHWQGWQFHALASYDLLIDEKWVNGRKIKERWDERTAWSAVKETIAAAQYFNQNRATISPRILVMGCQGVTARQYEACVVEVLKCCKPGDWIGLGGWCILGMKKKWLPTFYETLDRCIPIIAQSPVNHVHIFGVMWLPALGRLQWMCDRYGLTCSTDSQKPLKDCRWKSDKNRKQTCARRPYWRNNVAWWLDTLAHLSSHKEYRAPHYQLSFTL